VLHLIQSQLCTNDVLNAASSASIVRLEGMCEKEKAAGLDLRQESLAKLFVAI
jgi:hypothetical protein